MLIFSLSSFILTFHIMTVPIHIKNTSNPPQSDELYNDRRVTNKYWKFLFLVILMIWINCVIESRFHRTRPNNLYYRIAEKNASKLLFNEEAQKIISDNNVTTTNNASVTIKHEPLPHDTWQGKNWILDMVTCNLAYLNTHYQKNGPIVIYANALFFTGLFVYSLVSIIRLDDHGKFTIVAGYVFFYAMMWHIYKCIDVGLNNTMILFDIPLAVIFIIWYMKPRFDIQRLKSFTIYSGMAVMISIILLILVTPLNVITIFTLYRLGLKNALFYPIAAGSLYIILTMYYYGQMVVSSVVDMSVYQRVGQNPRYGLKFRMIYLQRAFSIVSEYHFGTACYLATIILPRLKTLFVINEPEFKENPRFSTINRLSFILSGKVNNLSSLTTAATAGSVNHSDCVRKLIRHHLINEANKPKTYPENRELFMICLVFLISSNNLMLISLWALNFNFDSFIAMFSYFVIQFIFQLFTNMLSIDALLYTHWLISDEHVNIKSRSSHEEELETIANNVLCN